MICSGTKPEHQVPRHNRFAQTQLCSKELGLVKLRAPQIQTPEPGGTANSISVWIYGILADMSLVHPLFQPAEYGKMGLKRKRMLSLAQPTWVRQKANASQSSPTNYLCQRLSTHVNFCNAYTPIPLAQSLLWVKPEKNSRELHCLACLFAPECLVCSSEQLWWQSPPKPHQPTLLWWKFALLFLILQPNSSQCHSQCHITPKHIHNRTCSAEVNAGSQIFPCCAKRVVRLFTELKDMKSTMISLDVTSSYNPRSPTLITFCSFQQSNKNVSCLTKLAPCSGLKEKNLAPRCPS